MTNKKLDSSNVDNYICFLIAKNKFCKLDEKEKSDLENWLYSSVNNMELFGKIFIEKDYKEWLEIVSNLNVEEDYNRLILTLNKQNSRIIKRKKLRYAFYIASTVIILVMVFLMFRYIKYPNKILEPISKGETKAMLELPNGRKVYLSNNLTNDIIEVHGTVINIDSSMVSYENLNINTIDTVAINNKIYIPKSSEYKLKLSDGTEVFLNSDSYLEFPSLFIGANRDVILKGEAYFKVKSDSTKPFIVKTNGVDIKVIGTEFNVEAYEDDDYIRTTLVKGKVEVHSPLNTLNMLPNVQAVFNRITNIIDTLKVDVEPVIAWTKGQFYFKNTRMEDIMKELSRWYNFNVIYKDESIKDMLFDGRLDRRYTLDSVLDILEVMRDINIEVIDNNVILSN